MQGVSELRWTSSWDTHGNLGTRMGVVLCLTCWFPCDSLSSLDLDLTSVDTCNSLEITQVVRHSRIRHVSALRLYIRGRKEGTTVTELPTAIFHGHWMKKDVRKQLLPVTPTTDTVYSKDRLTPPLPKSLYFLLNDASTGKGCSYWNFLSSWILLRCNTMAFLNILWNNPFIAKLI